MKCSNDTFTCSSKRALAHCWILDRVGEHKISSKLNFFKKIISVEVASIKGGFQKINYNGDGGGCSCCIISDIHVLLLDSKSLECD